MIAMPWGNRKLRANPDLTLTTWPSFPTFGTVCFKMTFIALNLYFLMPKPTAAMGLWKIRSMPSQALNPWSNW